MIADNCNNPIWNILSWTLDKFNCVITSLISNGMSWVILLDYCKTLEIREWLSVDLDKLAEPSTTGFYYLVIKLK